MHRFTKHGINTTTMNNDVIMDNNALIKVNSIKYLGVIVDNKLN